MEMATVLLTDKTVKRTEQRRYMQAGWVQNSSQRQQGF